MWVGVHVCGCGSIRERMYAQFCPTLPNSPQLCSRLPRRIRWRMPNSTDKQYSQAIVTIYLSLRTVLLFPSPSLELHFIYPIVYIAFIFFDILAYNALLHGRTFACNALLHIMHVCMVALLHGPGWAAICWARYPEEQAPRLIPNACLEGVRSVGLIFSVRAYSSICLAGDFPPFAWLVALRHLLGEPPCSIFLAAISRVVTVSRPET